MRSSSTPMRALIIALFAGFAVMFSGGVASAASPSQTACEDSGGTFAKVNGSVSCTYETSDPVGNSEASGGQSQTRDTTTVKGGQGNLSNKETLDTSCTGPGNSRNC